MIHSFPVSTLPTASTIACMSIYLQGPLEFCCIIECQQSKYTVVKCHAGFMTAYKPIQQKYFYWCRLCTSTHGLLFVDDPFISFARSVVCSLSPKEYPSETRHACLDWFRFGIRCMRWRNLVDTLVFGFVGFFSLNKIRLLLLLLLLCLRSLGRNIFCQGLVKGFLLSN